MERVATLVARARGGDSGAYEILIRRFQDMAVGYGVSILRDFQLAEDAAQEAFLEAYRTLPALREPAAFPGWFRRIVFKQCDRIRRVHAPHTVPLDDVETVAATPAHQARAAEQAELEASVRAAIDALPDPERAATLMFYMGGYSHREVGAFLRTSAAMVKKRLHVARTRLRPRLMHLVEERVYMHRPSRDERFASDLLELLRAARAGDLDSVRRLLERDPRLGAGRDPFGNTALILAANSGHPEVAELVLASGVEPDVWESAAIGKDERVAAFIEGEPQLLDAFSPEGFTPLALAAHFGHRTTVELLLDRGADFDVVSRHPIGVTPLHAALFGRQVAVAELLIVRGADVRVRRGGAGLPRAGWTPLHYAAGCGFASLIPPLVERGADLDARDDDGRTPLEVAAAAVQTAAAVLLRTVATTRIDSKGGPDDRNTKAEGARPAQRHPGGRRRASARRNVRGR